MEARLFLDAFLIASFAMALLAGEAFFLAERTRLSLIGADGPRLEVGALFLRLLLRSGFRGFGFLRAFGLLVLDGVLFLKLLEHRKALFLIEDGDAHLPQGTGRHAFARDEHIVEVAIMDLMDAARRGVLLQYGEADA